MDSTQSALQVSYPAREAAVRGRFRPGAVAAVV